MGRAEIQRKLDPIVQFAEIGNFLDTAVKHYSSGMSLRLAYAVAAHLDAEILLVDEVLSVGDHEFQHKCLESAEALSHSGKTVLFVSHNLSAVTRMCEHALLLENGKLVAAGPTAETILTYLGREGERALYLQAPNPSKKVQLRRATVISAGKESVAEVSYLSPFRIGVDYEVKEATRGVSMAIGIGTGDRIPVFSTADFDESPEWLETREAGLYHTEVEIPGRWLNSGRYLVVLYLTNRVTGQVYDKIEALSFNITNEGTPVSFSGPAERKGVLQPSLPWTLCRA